MLGLKDFLLQETGDYLWQEIRDKLSTRSEQKYEDWVTGYLKHPDLADIFRPQNEIS